MADTVSYLKYKRSLSILGLLLIYALLAAGQALTGSEPGASSIVTIVDSTGDVGQYTSLALNSSGWPVISYFDNTNADLKVAVCNDAACTVRTRTTVDSTAMWDGTPRWRSTAAAGPSSVIMTPPTTT